MGLIGDNIFGDNVSVLMVSIVFFIIIVGIAISAAFMIANNGSGSGTQQFNKVTYSGYSYLIPKDSNTGLTTSLDIFSPNSLGTSMNGNLYFYDSNSSYVMQLKMDHNSLSSNYELRFPSKNGTLATLDDINGGSSSNYFTTTKEEYVSPSGNDSNAFDCGFMNPCKTIQYALNDLSRYDTSVGKFLYLADGIYMEDVNIPQYANGTLKIIGNSLIPDNVIIDGNVSVIDSTTTLLRDSNPSVKLYLDGITFKNSGYLLDLQNSDVELGYDKYINFYVGINAYQGSKVIMESGYDGNSYMDGNKISNSTALAANYNVYLKIDQDLNVNNVAEGALINNNSLLYLFPESAINFNIDSIGTPFGGLIIRYGSILRPNGIINISGNPSNPARYGIELQDKAIFSPNGNSVFNISNFSYGILGDTDSLIDLISNTFNYVNVTTKAYLETTVNVFSFNNPVPLNTVITWYPLSGSQGTNQLYLGIYTTTQNLYVNSITGNDTNGNNGSISQPYRTISKALNLATNYYVSAPEVDIHIADGNYTESDYLTGSSTTNYIKLLGDSNNPDNVNWQPTASNLSSLNLVGVHNHFLIDGITFKNSSANSTYAVYSEGGTIDFGYNKFINNYESWYGTFGSSYKFLTGYNTTIVDGNNIPNGDATIMTNGSTLLIDTNMTITGTAGGLFIGNGSRLTTRVHTYNITLESGSIVGAIILRNGSYGQLSGTYNLNGNTGNNCIEADNQSEFILNNSSVYNMSNATYGWKLTKNTTISGASITNNFNTIGTNAYADPSLYLNVTSGFPTVTYDNNIAGDQVGYDSRYIQIQSNGFTGIKTIRASGGLADCDMNYVNGVLVTIGTTC